MPTATKPRQKRSALSPIQQRIREAEKKNSPIGTERVGVDEDGYEMVAVLCERGFGKKAEVLRQALASGLKAMKAASEPQEPESPSWEFVTPPGAAFENPLSAGVTYTPAVPFSAVPIVTPPSQQRLLEEPEEEAVE